MRKTLFSLALAMAVLSSCSSDDIVNNPMNEENHSFPASRSLHENILSFSSEEEYNALLDSLGTLSDEELLQWESGQKGFTSMYRMHSEALGQILNATCKEEYESIKTAYQTDFIFNDKDSTDLSIYMPVLNVSKAITLTPEGFVCIAGERKNMKEFENYDGYKKELSLLYPVPLGVTGHQAAGAGDEEDAQYGKHHQPMGRTVQYSRAGLLQRFALLPARPDQPPNPAKAQGGF